MVAVDPTNSDTIFVGEQNGTLKLSRDGGTTWTSSTLGCTNCGALVTVAVNPSNSQTVLIGMSQSSGAIQVSTNGGVSFTLATNGLGDRMTICQAAAIPHLRFDPSGSGIVMAATNSGAYMSSDLGSTWSSISDDAIPYAFTDLVWSGGNPICFYLRGGSIADAVRAIAYAHAIGCVCYAGAKRMLWLMADYADMLAKHAG